MAWANLFRLVNGSWILLTELLNEFLITDYHRGPRREAKQALAFMTIHIMNPSFMSITA